MSGAAAYVRELSLRMCERYSGDCVGHASRIAQLLLAEGRAPWIGRVRQTVFTGDNVFHAPLVPLRYLGKGSLAWTTHYVACSGRDVYDPLAGSPIDRDAYGEAVFGKAVNVETQLDAGRTARAFENIKAAVARIELFRGDITTLTADAIVNAANSQLTPGGEVGLAIHAAAGPELAAECMSLRRAVFPGDAAITGAHRLNAKYVIHAVGGSYHERNPRAPEQLASAYRRSFELAREHGVRTIAFPAISCGTYSFPPVPAAEIAIRETLAALERHPSLERVTFALFTDEVHRAFEQALRSPTIPLA